jgi:Holliday junction DNA helicase RuvB
LLPSPLRDRFGFTAQLDFYDDDELAVIVRRSASLLEVAIDDEAVLEIGSRSRGTPRVANRLLRRVRDWAEVHGDGSINLQAAQAALSMYEVDAIGLDRLDRTLLETLVVKFKGGPVGLSTLAMSMGEEAETLEGVSEPYLLRRGLLARTPRGRIATAAGWAHLGLRAPQSELGIFDMPPLDA